VDIKKLLEHQLNADDIFSLCHFLVLIQGKAHALSQPCVSVTKENQEFPSM
jgi:hypothetical protein